MYIVIVLFLLMLLVYFDQTLMNFILNNFKEEDLSLLIAEDLILSFQIDRLKSASLHFFLLIFFPFIPYQTFYLVCVVALTIYAYKKPYLKLKKEYSKQRQLIRFQFPIWIRQIQVLLSHNNVIRALELSLSSAPNLIKKELVELVSALKEEPNNYQAYSMFMAKYNIIEVNRAMKLLYQCQLTNQQDSMKQLQILANTTTKWLREERHEHQNVQSSAFEWLALLPLLGVTVVFIGIMFNLLNTLLGKGGIS